MADTGLCASPRFSSMSLNSGAKSSASSTGCVARGLPPVPSSKARPWRMGVGLALLSCPLLAALLGPVAAAAATPGPHWVQATPSGGSIVALERSSLTLYALTDNGDL